MAFTAPLVMKPSVHRRLAASSSWIVPTAWPSVIVECTGLERFTVNVSSGSIAKSPLTWTVATLKVVPGGNTSVPEPAM